ncbi:MAG: hypothetical protein IMX00_07635 [Limnochordales bacterium]|nr:hypothetical protein [Limnochordales bacterium]
MFKRLLRLAGYVLAYQTVRMIVRSLQRPVTQNAILGVFQRHRPAPAGFMGGWFASLQQALRWTGRLTRILQ